MQTFENCSPRRYAGQLPASISFATRCQLGIDAGLSGSATSGSSGGSSEFGNVFISTLAGGSSGTGSTSSSTTLYWILGGIAAVILFFFLKRK